MPVSDLDGERVLRIEVEVPVAEGSNLHLDSAGPRVRQAVDLLLESLNSWGSGLIVSDRARVVYEYGHRRFRQNLSIRRRLRRAG